MTHPLSAEAHAAGRADSCNIGTLGDLVTAVAGWLGPVVHAEPDADLRAEARDLVAAVLDEPRFFPSLHRAQPASPSLVDAARRAADRRARGAPFAYAVGRAAFRSLTLAVDPRVLIPRCETELLVDLVLQSPQGRAGGVAVDVGTGSGAIALALAIEGRFDRVIATDLSADALMVAEANRVQLASQLRSPVELRAGGALAPLLRGGDEPHIDVLVSNPPYIAFDELADLPAGVRDWEPSGALVCADGGLAVTKQIVRDAPRALRTGGLLALEVDARRAAAVAALIRDAWGARCAPNAVSVRPDFSGRDRFVLATLG